MDQKKIVKIEQLDRGFLTVTPEGSDQVVKAFDRFSDVLVDVQTYFGMPEEGAAATLRLVKAPEEGAEEVPPEVPNNTSVNGFTTTVIAGSTVAAPVAQPVWGPGGPIDTQDARDAALAWLEREGVEIAPRTRNTTLERMVADVLTRLAEKEAEFEPVAAVAAAAAAPVEEPVAAAAAAAAAPVKEPVAVAVAAVAAAAPVEEPVADNTCPFCHDKKTLFGKVPCLFCGKDKVDSRDIITYANAAMNSLPEQRRTDNNAIIEKKELIQQCRASIVRALNSFGASKVGEVPVAKLGELAAKMVPVLEEIVNGPKLPGNTVGDDEWVM